MCLAGRFSLLLTTSVGRDILKVFHLIRNREVVFVSFLYHLFVAYTARGAVRGTDLVCRAR